MQAGSGITGTWQFTVMLTSVGHWTQVSCSWNYLVISRTVLVLQRYFLQSVHVGKYSINQSVIQQFRCTHNPTRLTSLSPEHLTLSQLMSQYLRQSATFCLSHGNKLTLRGHLVCSTQRKRCKFLHSYLNIAPLTAQQPQKNCVRRSW